jgi:PAS domain S-box-containing protein
MDLDVIVLCLRTVVVTEVVRMNEFAVESSVKVVLDLNEKIRVLHVDDDSAILRITKQRLEMEGPLQVETALSVKEALARLEKEKFDVVVSDYQMPGKDGLEFLKILREKGNMIPFIFFTRKGTEEIAIKALNLGANQYLNKVGETETVYAELTHSIMELIRVRKAEKAIQQSNSKFESLFFGNPEAAAYLEPDSRILNVNPRFEELFGYSLEEIKGRHINDVIVQKAKKEEAETLDRKAVEGYVYFNTERRRKDGFAVPVAVSAAPIKAEGKLVGIVAMYKDISQLKSAEKRLVTLNEKLQVVGQLTRHDVRNKLSTIIGNAYLLKKQFVGDGGVLDKIKDMETAVQQITKIFEFAKAYESLGVEELTYMDVAKSVDEAASLFPDLKGAKMTNNCCGLMVLADSLLRQLFYNLVDNSLKYGKKTKMIKVYYEADGRDKLRLVYEDDGVGIPEAEKPKLFKEGYSTGGSTGYGLYMIKKMTEVYGWAIEETGEPGKGAQFTITVPKVNQNGKEIYRIAKSSSCEAPSTS